MLTLDKFEQATEVVKKVAVATNLLYSDYFSEQTGNKVYLKPENMQVTGAYKVRGAYYKLSTMADLMRLLSTRVSDLTLTAATLLFSVSFKLSNIAIGFSPP